MDTGSKLIEASRNGDFSTVKSLIDSGANVNAMDDDQLTALHHAVIGRNRDIVELLISKGADVNAKGQYGQTPFSLTVVAPFQRRTLPSQGEIDCCRAMAEMLIASGAEIDIHRLATSGDIKRIKELIEKGADVNSISDDGESLITSASWGGQWELVRFLGENGGNVNGMTGYRALGNAAYGGSLDTVKYLVEEGSCMETEGEEATPLQRASAQGHLEIIQYLVTNGANVNTKNKYGYTALMEAAKSGSLEIVKFLVEKGADVDAKDRYSATALIRAAGQGHLEVVSFLVKKGACVNQRTTHGQSALSEAAQFDHQKVVQFLKSTGAK